MTEFNSYYTLVKDSLVSNFHYTEVEANNVLEGYYTIIERIGEFDNPQIWASKIDEAMNSNITPDMWLAVL